MKSRKKQRSKSSRDRLGSSRSEATKQARRNKKLNTEKLETRAAPGSMMLALAMGGGLSSEKETGTFYLL